MSKFFQNISMFLFDLKSATQKFLFILSILHLFLLCDITVLQGATKYLSKYGFLQVKLELFIRINEFFGTNTKYWICCLLLTWIKLVWLNLVLSHCLFLDMRLWLNGDFFDRSATFCCWFKKVIRMSYNDTNDDR